MALPRKFVDEIHFRLAVRYGTTWAGKWDGMHEDLVKADWAAKLAGMSPAAIRAALENLPDEFPPTCAQFRKLGEAGMQHMPDAREVLRLQDERGGGKPPPEVLARLRRVRASLSSPHTEPQNDHV